MSGVETTHILRSMADTDALAAHFAAVLRSGDTVALVGDLGAGKTTFVRALCAALGITTPVSSPTFVLQHEYQGDSVRVEHWDLYRLNELPFELDEPPEEGTLRLVEWADKVPGLKYEVRLELALIEDGQERRATVQSEQSRFHR